MMEEKSFERNLHFDRVIERKHTGCLKYDFAKQQGMPEDLLPLWVADMDFETSSYIQDALLERIKHGIFGYSRPADSYFESVSNWMRERHHWGVKREWIVQTPGVVFALATSVKAYTQPGDAVLIQQPVYYPFSEVIKDAGRRVVSNTLYLGDDDRYHIDFDDFEKKIVDEQVRLFFLCSPHNPVARVWTKEELERLGDICVKHQVIVVSDEIHHDFVFQGEHTVFASVKKEFEDQCIICTAPSKTFNLASMMLSNIFIPNHRLRRKFKKEVNAVGLCELGVLGMVACEAAYAKGGEWYDAMMSYVADNIAFTKQYVEEKLPGVHMIDHEGTYLVWLDFRGVGLDAEALDKLIIQKAKLWLDSGEIFGESGKGFQRVNVACSRATLAEALERIKNALQGN